MRIASIAKMLQKLRKSEEEVMKNGTVWNDIDGKAIQAHGGMILAYEGMYYWYGENKDTATIDGRVDFIGISCYASSDLMHWTYKGLALEPVKEDVNHMLHPSKICERPKVLYHERTKKFVMWTHADTSDYTYAGVNITVSDTPIGPFHYVKSIQPNRQDSRDMTLFQDVDGQAYLLHSSNYNKTLNIARLTEDYLDVDGSYTSIFENQEREAPAIMCFHDMYYTITSGCSGWLPNPSLYGTCKHLIGPWKLIDNPCVGPQYRTTFQGQGTYIFFHKEQPYFMIDHWNPSDLRTSAYSILPITIQDDGSMEILWQEEFVIE